MKKVDSGNEFTQRRLVEMESTMERKMTEAHWETNCGGAQLKKCPGSHAQDETDG